MGKTEGFKLSMETRRKMSIAHKGKILSESHKRKISLANKGQVPWNKGIPHSIETRRKISLAHKNKKHYRGFTGISWNGHHSEESKRKISEAQRGKNNSNWRGGLSTAIHYGIDWESQRLKALERDGYLCQYSECDASQSLDVHHIIPYRVSKDNSLKNLLTLCDVHHPIVEAR